MVIEAAEYRDNGQVPENSRIEPGYMHELQLPRKRLHFFNVVLFPSSPVEDTAVCPEHDVVGTRSPRHDIQP